MLVDVFVNEIQNGLLFLRQHDRLLYPNTCMAVKCSVEKSATGGRRGIGLILALLVLSLLSILAAALLSAIAVDTWIGDNYRTETQLLYLTEAGIEDGREALSLGIPQPSVVPFIQNKPLRDATSREVGRYSVTLLRSNPLTLRSAGSLGTARKTIEVRLSKSGFPPLANAITLNENISIPGLDTQLETPHGVERIVEGIFRNATDVYTPALGEVVSLGAVGSPRDYRVVVVNGDCEIGNGAGYGILLVRGELTGFGSFSWNGLVLVIGQGVIRAAGTPAAWISGALFLTHTRAADRTLANPLGTLLDQRGVVTLDFPSESLAVEWNAAEVERANERFPYVRTTYREY
jgi:hypothetical protein